MKYIFLAIAFIFSSSFCFGQAVHTGSENVLAEIAKNDIENYGLGFAISQKRVKADSFFSQQPLDSALKFSQHQSHTVRYYAFLRILKLNDSLAFNYVKQNITDSTEIYVAVPCMIESLQFNKLLSKEYKQYIGYKSKGTSVIIDHRVYRFEKSDRKAGRAQLKQLNELLAANGLNKTDW